MTINPFNHLKSTSLYGGGLLLATLVLSATADMASHVPYETPKAEFLERFHGHLGPYVAIGAKMGADAVENQGLPKYFGVVVSATCPASPPHSCLLDGLQVGTGATMGKRNLSIVDGKEIAVTIRGEESGKRVTYRIKESVQAELLKWAQEEIDVEKRGQWIYHRTPAELFDIEVE
jgi:formylmethanofuran dehydrogenase subunit E